MAKKIYKTMRGRPIDMLAIAAANAEKQAIGNAKMNARGDILGPNGVVLRTQEQIEAEWRRNQQRQQEVAGISNNIKAPLPADKTAPRTLQADQNFEPDVAPVIDETETITPVDNAEQVKKMVQTRRKIVDAD
jgi:hypothetical protein